MLKLQSCITLITLTVFLLAEIIHLYRENKVLYRNKDTMANVCTGIVYFVSNIAARGLLFFYMNGHIIYGYLPLIPHGGQGY